MMIAWFGAALAITLGAISEEYELVDKFWHPLSLPAVSLVRRGLFWSRPCRPFAREIVLYIPMVHGVEMVREGFFGSKVEAIYDPGYVLVCSLVLSAVALIIVRWTEKRLVPQ